MASFYSRDKNGISLHYADAGNTTGQFILTSPPRAASWSPDGSSLAVCDSSRGIISIGLPRTKDSDAGDIQARLFPNSSKLTQGLWWSPRGTFLVSHHPVEKSEGEETRSSPNLLVWNMPTIRVVASFLVPKIEKGSKKPQISWTQDELFCCRCFQSGPSEFSLHILPGNSLNAEPLHVINHPTNMDFSWAPVSKAYDDPTILARLAVFCQDVRNDLKRVVGEAEVWVLDFIRTDDSDPLVNKIASTTVASGESAELLWSPSGTAVLAQVETEVDETGVSYYGSTRLVLLETSGANKSFELNKDNWGQYLPIQGVGWSPVNDTFVLIRGFQPSHVTLWKWDHNTSTITQLQTLLEKSHRNTVKWNPFGNLVLLAGFGNLAGDMDVFGTTRDSDVMAKVCCAQANCTVTAEWSTDGIHILTAVLFPRMRVENGFTLLNALTGKIVAKQLLDELNEVSWRPDQRKNNLPPCQDSIDQMAQTFVDTPKKQAYRPPKGRDAGGTNSVAAMMRGEIPVEKSRQKGNRNDRVQPSVRGVSDEKFEDHRRPKTPTTPEDSTKTESERERYDADSTPPKEEEIVTQQSEYMNSVPCPKTGWEYVDPKGKIQGPFDLPEMVQWNHLGYFKPELKMRCFPTDDFLELEKLFPSPLRRFESHPMIRVKTPKSSDDKIRRQREESLQ